MSAMANRPAPAPGAAPEAASKESAPAAGASQAAGSSALLEELYDLFCFLLTAARQLPREPGHYGPIRLVDAAARLAALATAHGLAHPGMDEALATVGPARRQALDDPAGLLAALDAAIVRLAALERAAPKEARA